MISPMKFRIKTVKFLISKTPLPRIPNLKNFNRSAKISSLPQNTLRMDSHLLD